LLAVPENELLPRWIVKFTWLPFVGPWTEVVVSAETTDRVNTKPRTNMKAVFIKFLKYFFIKFPPAFYIN
jgi:hypothetical protein